MFGMKYLCGQDAESLRGFFDGFLRLPASIWHGFLSGWKGLPGNEQHKAWYKRLTFALLVFFYVPMQVRISLLATALLQDGSEFFSSVLPPSLVSLLDSTAAPTTTANPSGANG